MAIEVKSIIVDALLALSERKPLSKITIADIQHESGISQTFYNYFKDKQACMMTEANCLVDFMYARSKAFDRAWL